MREVSPCTSAIVADTQVLTLIGEYPPDTLIQCQRTGGHAGPHSRVMVNNGIAITARTTNLTWNND